MVERNLKNLFGLIAKSVPAIDQITEVTREGIPKAFIPYFFHKPPFGYPRYTDLVTIRRLAGTPYVEMCINLILDEMCPIEWDIVTEDGVVLDETKQAEIDHIKAFFDNPNTNKESFEEIRRQYLRDVLEIDTGIVNKMFNMKEEMVEIVARDGATFTKNPDIYGMMTDREDIILENNIALTRKEESLVSFTPGMISSADVRERAAYFQYGWSTAARPVPFGKKELVWFEKNKRTDTIYGRGMVEILANTIQTFIYAIENDLEFFSDNQIPKGIIGLEGSNTEEIKAFKEQWVEQQRVKDNAGNWKKKMHTVPITGKIPKFETIQFTSAEMELIEKQKWWAKMVWACFGVTGSELGYTEDAKGMANQIVQSSTFKRRTVYPLLRLEEYRINHELISEFYESAKKKEIQKAIIKGLPPEEARKKVGEMEKKKSLPYQGLKFKFMVFDVEEETKKANLYKIQVDAGIRTINEIRKEEGLEELEWGSKDPKEREQQGFGNDDWGNPLGNEFGNKKEESSPDEKKKINSKDFELKFKYIKRTGSPGNYRYWYRDPKTGKLTEGKKPEEDESENKKEYFGDKAKDTMAHERFDLSKKKLISKEGSDRDVYELPDGKVIKLTKTLRGLAQNKVESETKIKLLPEIFETGKDYIIAEKVSGDNKKSEELLEGLKKFTASAFYNAHINKKYGEGDSEIQSELNKLEKKYPGRGFKEVLNYDLIAEDFLNPKNWGWKGEEPYHIDGGTFDAGLFSDKDSIKELFGKKWEEIKKERSNSKEEKAMMTMENPLILRENERPTADRLERSIVYLMKENEKKIKDLIEKEVGRNTLIDIKSIDDLIKAIKSLLVFQGIKMVSDAVIKHTYVAGWEDAEKQLSLNLMMNQNTIEFLQNHTFGNIKDMTDEIAGDLRAELERGVIAGESVPKLQARVEKVFDVGKNRAEMIARTEVNRAENNGRLQAFKTSGKEKEYQKKWISHIDERTSEICKHLDGQIVEMNDNFKEGKFEGQTAPAHVNCRSRVIYIKPGE